MTTSAAWASMGRRQAGKNYRLQGKAMIIIGEMDGNLDPTSSLHVVNALVKADKHFDMLYISRYLQDYCVRQLPGVGPPDWNKVTLPPVESSATGGN